MQQTEDGNGFFWEITGLKSNTFFLLRICFLDVRNPVRKTNLNLNSPTGGFYFESQKMGKSCMSIPYSFLLRLIQIFIGNQEHQRKDFCPLLMNCARCRCIWYAHKTQGYKVHQFPPVSYNIFCFLSLWQWQNQRRPYCATGSCCCLAGLKRPLSGVNGPARQPHWGLVRRPGDQMLVRYNDAPHEGSSIRPGSVERVQRFEVILPIKRAPFSTIQSCTNILLTFLWTKETII